MNQKDRELVENLLEKSISQQSKLFEEQFKGVNQLLHSMNELLTEKLNTIDSKVTITNGTVKKHTDQIQELQQSDTRHFINCPQKSEIQDINNKLINMEKIEVARKAVSKFTWQQLTVIGIISGIVFAILNFIFK